MSDSLNAFIGRLNQLADSYGKSGPNAVSASARTYVASIRSEIGSVTSGSRLRGIKSGGRVGVKYDLRTGGGNVTTAFVQGVGALGLLERGSRPHLIPRARSVRRLRTARGRGASARGTRRSQRERTTSGRGLPLLVIGGRVVTGPVQHPGARGKHPFSRGARRAESAALAAALNEIRTPLGRIFRG